MDDGQIVSLFLARDERAIAEAAQRHGGLCRALAMRLLGDTQDAEECVSDALLAAWNSIPPQKPEKLSAYLARLTRNLALKKRRDASRLKRGGGEATLAFEELDECLPSRENVEQRIEQRELTAAIERFLRLLPEDQGRVFLGRYWYFESVAELSERFGIGEGRVKSMLFRTRKKLKSHLEKEGLFFES